MTALTGMNEREGARDSELVILAVAEAAHEVNRIYCESIGDVVPPPWPEAPEWQRSSIIAGVRAIVAGNVASAEEQHEAWRDRRFKEGWRLGTEMNAQEKLHPNLVPYDALPVEQKRKDHLFRAVAITAEEIISALCPSEGGTSEKAAMSADEGDEDADS